MARPVYGQTPPWVLKISSSFRALAVVPNILVESIFNMQVVQRPFCDGIHSPGIIRLPGENGPSLPWLLFASQDIRCNRSYSLAPSLSRSNGTALFGQASLVAS